MSSPAPCPSGSPPTRSNTTCSPCSCPFLSSSANRSYRIPEFLPPGLLQRQPRGEAKPIGPPAHCTNFRSGPPHRVAGGCSLSCAARGDGLDRTFVFLVHTK